MPRFTKVFQEKRCPKRQVQAHRESIGTARSMLIILMTFGFELNIGGQSQITAFISVIFTSRCVKQP